MFPPSYDQLYPFSDLFGPFALQEAALANPNTTRAGRRHAKHELERMVRMSNHVSVLLYPAAELTIVVDIGQRKGSACTSHDENQEGVGYPKHTPLETPS